MAPRAFLLFGFNIRVLESNAIITESDINSVKFQSQINGSLVGLVVQPVQLLIFFVKQSQLIILCLDPYKKKCQFYKMNILRSESLHKGSYIQNLQY